MNVAIPTNLPEVFLCNLGILLFLKFDKRLEGVWLKVVNVGKLLDVDRSASLAALKKRCLTGEVVVLYDMILQKKPSQSSISLAASFEFEDREWKVNVKYHSEPECWSREFNRLP